MNIFMFDVESIGLHGEGFAFGAVVVDSKCNILDKCACACLNRKILEKLNKIDFFVSGEGKDIVKECSKLKLVSSLKNLREEFWGFYDKYRENSEIYSDVNYPVETNFLEEVYKDNKDDRIWKMPFPLLDASNHIPPYIDRTKEYIKDNSEHIIQDVALRKPVKHNPLWDSITSVHCLLKYRR